MIAIIAVVVSFLLLILGVPSQFKYYWSGSKIRRRKSARDISRKFYLVSWVIYVLQTIHELINGDWVNVLFWGVGIFTVAYTIAQCYRYWHVKMPFHKWLIDSFRGDEEGGI